MAKKYRIKEEQSEKQQQDALSDAIDKQKGEIESTQNNLKSAQVQLRTSRQMNQLPTGLGPDKATSDMDKKKYPIDVKSNTLKVQYFNDKLKNDRERAKELESEKIAKASGKDTSTLLSTTGNNTDQKTEGMKLSKEQILRVVESQEPARMKKRELIESISKLLIREDMNDDVKRKIDSGENDYSEHLDPETVKQMARSIMDGIKANLEAKTGGRGRVNMETAQRILSQGLLPALQKEQRHKPELERLAVQLVRQEYDIPEDAVDFDAKITGHPQMGGEEIRKTNLKMRKGNKRPPQNKSEEELKPNVTKRRLMNAMMHGAARKGQYMYHMAQDQLNRIAPGLSQDYSNIMAGNDFMYWGLDDNTISQESEGGTHAGQVRVDLSGPKPKIIAQGMTFPFLLHELTKGVLELMSLHGLDVDKETRDYVLDKTDNLEAEPWDIRLGPQIWEKFLESLDVDDLPYKSQIFNRLVSLPPDEFNSVVQGLVRGMEESRNVVREIADDVRREMNAEELDNATSQYRDPEPEGGEEHPEEDEDREDPVLKGLLGGKDEPQEEYDDPNTWSKRELEQAIDQALDDGDFGTVRTLTDILNSKF